MVQQENKFYNSIETAQLEYWNENRHPFDGGFEITPKCNFKCVHCYLDNNTFEKFLSTEEIITIIDKLYVKGVLFLYFTGGEILTRNDFVYIYSYAKKKGFIISLLTNISLLNEEHIDVFKKYPPFIVSISVYGGSEETYFKVTKTSGNFKRVTDNLAKLKENNINFEIKFIGLKENSNDLKLVEKIAKDLGVDFSYSFELFGNLQGQSNAQEHMIPLKDIVEIEKNDTKQCRIWSVNITGKNKYKEQKDVPLYMCSIGKSNFLIDCEGHLNPCNKMRTHKNSLIDMEFDDIWESFEDYRKLIASKSFICGKCDFISICNPCPANNLLSTGNYELPDKTTCELTKMRTKEFSKGKYGKYKLELEAALNSK